MFIVHQIGFMLNQGMVEPTKQGVQGHVDLAFQRVFDHILHIT